MSDMKCPICGEILQKYGEVDTDTGTSVVLGANCRKCGIGDSDIKLWQALIDTKEKLLVCEECCRKWETDYHFEFEKSTRLENKLKTTRKALDVAVDALDVISLKQHKTTQSVFLIKYAQYALEQIESITKAKEQQ